MTHTLKAVFVTSITLAMLLCGASQVNAAMVDQASVRQGGGPLPGGTGGGHFSLRQGGGPLPGGTGGGHFSLRQGGGPLPGGTGGGH